MSLWRNRLARSAVNRKVGGSSPPRDAAVFLGGGKCRLACADREDRSQDQKATADPREGELWRKTGRWESEVLERVQPSECLLTMQLLPVCVCLRQYLFNPFLVLFTLS